MSQSLRYELGEVERLINSVNDNMIIDETNGKAIASAIQQEVGRVKLALIQEVFTIGDEQHLERYIQYHQQAVIRLLDTIIHRQRNRVYDLFHGEFYQNCYSVLEGLLSFVERHFTKYFDIDAKVPDSYLILTRKDVTGTSKSLRHKLHSLGADSVLVEVALYSLMKFLTSNAERHNSYRRIIYVKDVQKELTRLVETSHENIDQGLRASLYYLNYNSIKAFSYFTGYISQLLSTSETHVQKVETLSLLLKQINQSQVKPNIGYNHLAEPLRVQLSGYVIEEIEYLEKLHGLISGTNQSQQSVLPQSEFKLNFDLSVAQLAYLVKIFIEAKIIQHQNTTEVLKFFSKIAFTKRTEHISYDSLRAKFYNTESNTKQSIRDLFSRLIVFIDRN